MISPRFFGIVSRTNQPEIFNRLPKEIRDECRQDPTIPKRTLIEIARKKQERSMLTEFKKYRDQQVKAAAKETADFLQQSIR